MIQTIFKRYEKKYLLSPMQYSFLKKHLDQILQVDTYGLHTICSIYFDTDDYSLIRSSLEKPVYKEKLRLRSYGIPKDTQDTVFLELKKNTKVLFIKDAARWSFVSVKGIFTISFVLPMMVRSCMRSTGFSITGTPLRKFF